MMVNNTSSPTFICEILHSLGSLPKLCCFVCYIQTGGGVSGIQKQHYFEQKWFVPESNHGFLALILFELGPKNGILENSQLQLIRSIPAPWGHKSLHLFLMPTILKGIILSLLWQAVWKKKVIAHAGTRTHLDSIWILLLADSNSKVTHDCARVLAVAVKIQK